MISKSNLFFLLFTTIIFSCSDNKKSESSKITLPKIHKGYLDYGHVSSRFRPLGSEASYLVLDNSNSKLEELNDKDDYFEIYIEMIGLLDTTRIRNIDANQYDGLISIDSIIQVKKFGKQNSVKSKKAQVKTGQCFEYFDKSTGRVVSILELQIKKNKFKGFYSWDGAESDATYGVLKHGVIEDHIFLAEYHYTLDGKKMIQEVVFKKIQQGYLKGFGEFYDDNGIYRIDKEKEIDFATGLFYRNLDCN